MNGPDVEGVLERHAWMWKSFQQRPEIVCKCGDRLLPSLSSAVATLDDHRAHVVVAVLAEVRAWLESEAVCQVVAYAVERAEKPKNATYDDVARAALAALAAQVAPSRVPGEES